MLEITALSLNLSEVYLTVICYVVGEMAFYSKQQHVTAVIEVPDYIILRAMLNNIVISRKSVTRSINLILLLTLNIHLIHC